MKQEPTVRSFLFLMCLFRGEYSMCADYAGSRNAFAVDVPAQQRQADPKRFEPSGH